jgi:uncharacterized protein
MENAMAKKIIGLVMQFRIFTLIILLGITAVFGYGISRMAFFTEFMELFPSHHPFVKIHNQYVEYFGGANIATLVLEVQEGDVFQAETLEKMIRINDAVLTFPDVNPDQVFSLASPRVLNVTEISGGIHFVRMLKNVPASETEMADLKSKVLASVAYGTWVSEDLKALRLQASFLEKRLDYDALHEAFIRIRETEEDDNHRIYLAGEPMLNGWIYHHVKETAIIFLISCGILVLLLYFFMGRQPIWWIPLISAVLSSIWGLGIAGYLGYQLDPLIVVVPFLLTARAMSHGIQWLNRFGNEFRRTGDVEEASRVTGVELFYPCIIGVVTDACGILIVALIPIPILQHLAILGFFWGLSVIFTVALFNPVFVSFLPLKADSLKENLHRVSLTNLMAKLAGFSITKTGKVILISGSTVILLFGLVGFARVPIGDANPGSPILWPDSDYNKSVAAISSHFSGMDQIYVLVKSNPDTMGSLILPDTLRAMDSFKEFMINRGYAVMGFSLADNVRAYNRLAHENDPKFDFIPNSPQEVLQIISISFFAAAQKDMDKFISPDFSDANVRLFMRDHKGDTLKRVIAGMKEWIAGQDSRIITVSMADRTKRVLAVEFKPAGGLGGILAAANELIEKANHWLVAGILAFTFFCCTVVYRSLMAGFIFVISLVLANFTSFSYMAVKGIGLNINTIPVVSLGVGLGVDYGLYIVSRIKERIAAGASWEEGIISGVSSTGRAVFYQAIIMSASVFFWWFSPLRFQAEMGFLLSILMMVNMIVGVLLLPALIHIFKPGFVAGK